MLPEWKVVGVEYPPGSWLGPMKSCVYTRDYCCDRVICGPHNMWVHVWCKYSKDGFPIGASFCRVTGDLPVYASATMNKYGDL